MRRKKLWNVRNRQWIRYIDILCAHPSAENIVVSWGASKMHNRRARYYNTNRHLAEKAYIRRTGMPIPYVGMVVCDCRLNHQKIKKVIPDGYGWSYDLVLEDGYGCSYEHCCNQVPHPEWTHEEILEQAKTHADSTMADEN